MNRRFSMEKNISFTRLTFINTMAGKMKNLSVKVISVWKYAAKSGFLICNY